jgi:hypothetical protein
MNFVTFDLTALCSAIEQRFDETGKAKDWFHPIRAMGYDDPVLFFSTEQT